MLILIFYVIVCLSKNSFDAALLVLSRPFSASIEFVIISVTDFPFICHVDNFSGNNMQ